MGSEQIVYADGPGPMKFLVHFMVSVNIHRYIHADIVRVSGRRSGQNIWSGTNCHNEKLQLAT